AARFDIFGKDVADARVRSVALELVIDDKDRAGFEKASGMPISDAAPGGGFRPAPRRAQYCPIVQVSPVPQSGPSGIGFDICGDPVRGAAARAARASSRIEVSGKLKGAVSGKPLVYLIRALRPPAGGPRAAPVGYVSLGFFAAD